MIKLILNPTPEEALAAYPKGDHPWLYIKKRNRNMEKTREDLVLLAMFLDQKDPEAIDRFDRALCAALGLDPEENPPHFIFDALAAS